MDFGLPRNVPKIHTHQGVKMTTEQLRKKARCLYNNDMVPEHINRHNQRKWVRAVLRLGENWLTAKPIGRLDATQSNP
jgi:hypothetical protein